MLQRGPWAASKKKNQSKQMEMVGSTVSPERTHATHAEESDIGPGTVPKEKQREKVLITGPIKVKVSRGRAKEKGLKTDVGIAAETITRISVRRE